MVMYVEAPSPDKVVAPEGLSSAEEVYWIGRYVAAMAHGMPESDAADRAGRDLEVMQRLLKSEHEGLIVVKSMLKHLPGQHDQSRHRPKKYAAGGEYAQLSYEEFRSISGDQSRARSTLPDLPPGMEIESEEFFDWMAEQPSAYGTLKKYERTEVSGHINGRLRLGEPMTEYLQEVVDGMEHIFWERMPAGSTSPKNVKLYRALPKQVTDGLELGDSVLDLGYSSTSYDREYAENFGSNVVEIQLNAGDKAIFTGSGEGEVILPRGTELEKIGPGVYRAVVPSYPLPIGTQLKHLAGRHDQKKHDPTKGAGRPVPSDAVSFTGTLYHNTSLEALPGIEHGGLRPGTGGLGKQADGVYFIRQPVEAGTAREAMLSVDFEDAKLAPTSSKYQEIHSEVKDELLAEAKAKPLTERQAIRDRAYGDYAFQEAARRYTQLGYDGYEQGWDVVVITNLDLLQQTTRVKHMAGRHDQRFHTPHKFRTHIGVSQVRMRAGEEVYANSAAYQAAIDAVKPKMLDVFRERHPDREPPDWDDESFNNEARTVVEVSTYDEERFDYYANKYGIPLELKDELMALDGQVSNAMLRAEMRYKDQATFKSPHTGNPSNNAGELWGTDWVEDAYVKARTNPVGSDVIEAGQTLMDKYDVHFSIDGDVTERHSTIHREVSDLLYMAEAEPAIANLLRNRVKSIRYVTDLKTSRGDANFNSDTGELKIAKKTSGFMNNFPVLSTTWIHELGHAADPIYDDTGAFDTRGRERMFGMGRHVSSYAWTNDNEDWAESWVAAFTNDNGEYSAYAPDKIAYVTKVIEAWRQ